MVTIDRFKHTLIDWIIFYNPATSLIQPLSVLVPSVDGIPWFQCILCILYSCVIFVPVVSWAMQTFLWAITLCLWDIPWGDSYAWCRLFPSSLKIDWSWMHTVSDWQQPMASVYLEQYCSLGIVLLYCIWRAENHSGLTHQSWVSSLYHGNAIKIHFSRCL